MFRISALSHLRLLVVIFTLQSGEAVAACTSPAGTAGQFIHNADHTVIQYCDNTNWVPLDFGGSGQVRIYLTTSPGAQTWTVPANWNSSNNTIEAVGAGEYGQDNQAGGGGAYAKITNLTLTPGASISYNVGWGDFGIEKDSWFNGTTCLGSSICADGASTTNGGQAANSVGTLKYSGGNSGGAGCGTYNESGGGGAAGPNGAGGNGSPCTTGVDGAGGTADGGTVPSNSSGAEWDVSHGIGAGTPGALCGSGWWNYGGGAGGDDDDCGSIGGQGIIVITYAPTSSCTSPTGTTGQMLYNKDYHVYQVCTATGWKAVGKKPSTNVYVLTSGTTWTVPANWNSSNNMIEAIGGGQGGEGGASSQGGAGGAGGSYAKIYNATLTPGASVSYSIGAGSSSVASAGGDTTFSSILRAPGGGSASSFIGTVTYAGGPGGAWGGSFDVEGGGGGGAAGSLGAGLTGEDGNDAGAQGGTGNNGYGGISGSNGSELLGSVGSGGGAAGAGASAPAGLYGGGGSGSTCPSGGSPATCLPGAGSQGVIVITNLPGCTSPTGTDGQIIYNSDQNVMQYCNGESWIKFAK